MRIIRRIALTGTLSTSLAYSVWAGAAPQSFETPIDETPDKSANAAPDNTAKDTTKDAPKESSAAASQVNARDYSKQRHNSLRATTGLLHLIAADSGAPGTFRLTLLTSYYSGSGFLCPKGACGTPPAGAGSTDSVSRMGMDLGVSATLLPFLEASAGIHSHAFSDDFGKPPLVQVLGDTYLGLKGFLPRKADNPFGVGAFTELRLLNGSGSIGPETANLALGALGTLDLTNRSDPSQQIPLRLHSNFGYLFDNSASIAKDTEASRHAPISRIERFGMGINRVDSFFMGIGAEYVSAILQPFAEWTVDVANNRQGYKCPRGGAAEGDICKVHSTGMRATPSRLTLGTRLTPGVGGLNAVLALDIGTSGTSQFVDERAPEIPWDLFVGVGWATDTVSAPPPAPKPLPPQVIRIAPAPEYHVAGTVVDEETHQPIARAIIDFEGREVTGMVSRADGRFETGRLEPGNYTFRLSAEGYKDGSCGATVVATPPSQSGAKAVATAESAKSDAVGPRGAEREATEHEPAKPEAAKPSAADPSEPGKTESPILTQVECRLKAAPPVGSIHIMATSAETGAPIAGAIVRVRDKRERLLELQSDFAGSVKVENVPAGNVQLLLTAAGYLPQSTALDVKKKSEQVSNVSLKPLPKKPNVKVTATELKLASPIRFGVDTADLTPESMALVQEVAATLGQHPELTSIEIQSYADEPAGASFSKRLSEERGQKLREQLTALGVNGDRLTVKAFGSEKPLLPGAASEAAREKNRRIVLRIAQKQ